MASLIIRFIAALSLMLLGAAPAWAGRGDIDPNYGEGGDLAPGPGRVFSLPDDRLLIDVSDSAGAFKIRVVDVGGKDDPTFGNGGHATVQLPPATPQFMPDAAALGPDGEVYVEGTLWAEGQARFYEVFLRLDATGQLDLSYGGQGDGFFRLNADPIEYTPDWKTTLAALTVDAAGRIVVAQHGWTPDNVCVGPMVLRRFLANAEPDPAFGTTGTVELPDLDLCAGVSLFAAREDGSIVVGDRSTIVAIGTTGGVDAGFGANGHLHNSDSAWSAGFLLPDEGLLLFESIRVGTGPHHPLATHVSLVKSNRNGQVDSRTEMAIAIDYPGASGARGSIGRLMLAPGATHLLAETLVFRLDDATLYCRGIARFSIDGMLDDQFGRQGLTCLSHGGFTFSLLSVQKEGAPIFQLHGPQGILRLLPDDMPSPGLVTAATQRPAPGDAGYPAVSKVATESSGTITQGFIRTAGRDGAVSINYETGPIDIDPLSFYGYGVRSASADIDYVTTSGRLNWANGEDGEQTATVTIREDGLSEPLEVFGLMASDLEGGAMAIALAGGIGILDDDDAVSNPESPSQESGGGGGSSSWAHLLALLTLLSIGRRFLKERTELSSAPAG